MITIQIVAGLIGLASVIPGVLFITSETLEKGRGGFNVFLICLFTLGMIGACSGIMLMKAISGF